MRRQLPRTITAEKSPDWLPAGWIMVSKQLRSGRETRSYLQLQTGRKFATKDEVLQFVAMEKARAKKPQHTGMKVYKDPLTGCKFYCKPQALQYLGYSTEEQEKTSIGVNYSREQIIPFPETKALTEVQDEGAPSKAELAISPIAKVPFEECLVNVSFGTDIHTKEISGFSGSTGLLEAEGNKVYQLISDANPMSEIFPEKKSYENESEIEKVHGRNTEQTADLSMHTNEVPRQARYKHGLDVPCEASGNVSTFHNINKEPVECQAMVDKPESSVMLSFGKPPPDPCLEFVFKTLTSTVPVEILTNNRGLVSKKSRGNKRQKSSRKENSSRKIKAGDSKLPRKSSKQLAEPEMVPSTLHGERIHGIAERNQSTEKINIYPSRKTKESMKHLRENLSDMCSGFSFKSLIGENSMEDDSVISNYLKQYSDSRSTGEGSLPLPDFGLPNFSQIEISPDEPEEQPTIMRKQWPANPSLLQAGNVPSLPSCSVIGSQLISMENNEGNLQMSLGPLN